jgi:hypothetical protein
MAGGGATIGTLGTTGAATTIGAGSIFGVSTTGVSSLTGSRSGMGARCSSVPGRSVAMAEPPLFLAALTRCWSAFPSSSSYAGGSLSPPWSVGVPDIGPFWTVELFTGRSGVLKATYTPAAIATPATPRRSFLDPLVVSPIFLKKFGISKDSRRVSDRC